MVAAGCDCCADSISRSQQPLPLPQRIKGPYKAVLPAPRKLLKTCHRRILCCDGHNRMGYRRWIRPSGKLALGPGPRRQLRPGDAHIMRFKTGLLFRLDAYSSHVSSRQVFHLRTSRLHSQAARGRLAIASWRPRLKCLGVAGLRGVPKTSPSRNRKLLIIKPQAKFIFLFGKHVFAERRRPERSKPRGCFGCARSDWSRAAKLQSVPRCSPAVDQSPRSGPAVPPKCR
jgi:hypothetical protein